MVERGVRPAHRLGRWGWTCVPLFAALAATAVFPPAPLLVWNVSPSAPVGLYFVAGRRYIAAGDMAVAQVPARWRPLAAERRYVPVNVPLVKRVAAAAGDTVCARGGAVYVNGRRVAARLAEDQAGRAMPRWHGCTRLGREALLLLNDHPLSFDGRYFGTTPREDVVGRAVPLWTR